MDWKKNDVFQTIIEDMSDSGEGIGKTDGFTWFIKDAVIGDRVEAKAMKVKKSYGFARLLQVLEPSDKRTAPLCPVARQCGGCQIQAMDYQEQLHFKENKVCSNLRRIGGLEHLIFRDEEGSLRNEEDGTTNALRKEESIESGAISVYPIMGMENPWRYRNKAQFPFGRSRDGRIIAGFYAGRTHSIIETEDCLLGVRENSTILQCIREHMEQYKIEPYDEANHRGLVRHVLIRKGFRTGELMVCLVLNGEVKALTEADVLVERLRGLFGDGTAVTSISVSINREKTNVIMGSRIVNLYGAGYITDYIGNVKYRISPLSFYQVNPVQTEKLYSTALEYAELTGKETVWDLYCGIGTISLFLAQKAKQVYGVEIVPQAIEDARANARLNGMDNVSFFVGKAEEVLPEQYEKHQVYADVIVVDPPRKGCDTVCLDTIVKMGPKRVVYVSCDSATLARDVKYLGERGYQVEKVRCCDMFGHSTHVETVCQLVLRKPAVHINIDVDVEELVQDKRGAATYGQIKDYVLEHSGLKVSSLYIAQVKQKCGIIERENYNKSKSEDAKQPQCPPEKEAAIMEALRYYGMIK